jgi:hypothetical protein
MALRTKGNQVFNLILATLRARLLMVDFKIGALAAVFALPAVAGENLQPNWFVCLRLKPLSAHGEEYPG